MQELKLTISSSLSKFSSFLQIGESFLEKRNVNYPSYLKGSVKIEGKPAEAKIVVFNKSTLKIVGITRSRADGSWCLKGLPNYGEKNLFVVAFDHLNKTHNAQIFDLVSQYNPHPPAVEEAVTE